MPTKDIARAVALVTGASRGFGRGIAIALSQAGARVTGVARDRAEFQQLRAELGGSFTPVGAGAADPVTAGQLIDDCRPAIVVLNAGATPLARPLQHHTWESFSRNWEVDVRHVFCSPRSRLAARLSRSPAARHCAAPPCPAGTEGPRPPSGSSPPTPPTSPSGQAWASGSSACCRS